ncbi:hypothetical protein [Rhizobium sp. C4]|uniref:hypothetical protein n=1 Tax=Rhizobium sp. C4 TaxID=1349800 RepID=UPI001E5C67F0|nr:hypothetical protein [Rhizobium sp. C4]MCD2173553.1 hypothetical protein [Rhizobium sp. C4]
MTQNPERPKDVEKFAEEIRRQVIAWALPEATPAFNLPPLPRSRRTDIRVPASFFPSDNPEPDTTSNPRSDHGRTKKPA